MTDLTIVPTWNAAINRLERNEFAAGGADGNMNIAPRQLAENVFWLKADIDGKLTTLTEYNTVQDAAINGKASASDVDAKNGLQDAAISSKASTTDVNAKNGLQDTAISQNTTDISALSVTVSEHTTAINDLQSGGDVSAGLAKIRILALAGL